jgi:Arc/MetJ-type ribon-helix-helix transcriptional regulator
MSKQTEFEIESTVIATRITKPMYEALLRLLTLDAHITISDYIRDLIRRDLEQKGLLKTKPQGE